MIRFPNMVHRYRGGGRGKRAYSRPYLGDYQDDYYGWSDPNTPWHQELLEDPRNILWPALTTAVGGGLAGTAGWLLGKRQAAQEEESGQGSEYPSKYGKYAKGMRIDPADSEFMEVASKDKSLLGAAYGDNIFGNFKFTPEDVALLQRAENGEGLSKEESAKVDTLLKTMSGQSKSGRTFYDTYKAYLGDAAAQNKLINKGVPGFVKEFGKTRTKYETDPRVLGISDNADYMGATMPQVTYDNPINTFENFRKHFVKPYLSHLASQVQWAPKSVNAVDGSIGVNDLRNNTIYTAPFINDMIKGNPFYKGQASMLEKFMNKNLRHKLGLSGSISETDARNLLHGLGFGPYRTYEMAEPFVLRKLLHNGYRFTPELVAEAAKQRESTGKEYYIGEKIPFERFVGIKGEHYPGSVYDPSHYFRADKQQGSSKWSISAIRDTGKRNLGPEISPFSLGTLQNQITSGNAPVEDYWNVASMHAAYANPNSPLF